MTNLTAYDYITNNLKVSRASKDKTNHLTKEKREKLHRLAKAKLELNKDNKLSIYSPRTGKELTELIFFPINDIVVVDVDNWNGEKLNDSDRDLIINQFKPNAYQITKSNGLHMIYFKEQDYKNSMQKKAYLDKDNFITYDIKNGENGETSTSFHYYGLIFLETEKRRYIENIAIFEPEPRQEFKQQKTHMYKGDLNINWIDYFINVSDINVMNKITPYDWFRSNPTEQRYKFLSLYITRLKQYDLLTHENQKNAFIEIINAIHRYQKLETRARLIQLVNS